MNVAYRRNLSSTEVAQPSCKSPGADAYLRNMVAGRARPARLYSPPRSAFDPSPTKVQSAFNKRCQCSMQTERGIGRPSKTCTSEDLGRCRQIHAQTAATHHAVPTGAGGSAPDVRQGPCGGRRARFGVIPSCCDLGPRTRVLSSSAEGGTRRASFLGVVASPWSRQTLRVSRAYRYV